MDYFLKRVIDSFTNLTETSEVMIEKPASIENLSAAATQKVTDTARVFEKSWEEVQKKTFTNWINSYLKKCNAPPITDISTDLSSGENLILLLQVIGDESLGKFNRNPRIRLQKIENVNKALEFIKRRGVQLTNIGGEDIVDSNEKLILGLIWSIILRFSIASISEEGLTAKEGLLLWCQRRTTPYEADFKIKDFTSSWQDGLALCALIHRHRPDLINYHALDKKQKLENTRLAMDIAENQLNIPKLFAAEDVVECVRPDERSVMTYIAQYFHAFSALGKFDVAGRRVGALGNLLQGAWDMQNDYETRARNLIEGIAAVKKQWSATSFNGYLDAKQKMSDFEDYKMTTKRVWVSEKRELDSLLGNIQTKLKTYNLRPYSPPDELSLEKLNSRWNELLSAEAAQKRGITTFIRNVKDKLRKEFADSANEFEQSVNELSLKISSMTGELESQLSFTQGLILKTEPLKNALVQLSEIDQQCIEASIDDNEYTIYSVEDLSFEFGLLVQNLVKKTKFIENQMVARSKTNFTPQQLEEYSETFRVFDKDGSNGLERHEFKAALQANCTSIDEAKFEDLFLKLSEGANEINFEQFIEYARSLEEDKVDPENINLSFETLAGDKQFVTEADMYRGGLSATLVEYLKTQLPKKEEGYDYKSFISHIFI